MRRAAPISWIVLLAVGCAPAPAGPPRELEPVDDPAEEGSPFRVPQPHRERPSAIVYDAARERLWVALSGTESESARSLVVLDARTFAVERRVEVGPFPVAMAIHPAGRHLIVLNRFARYASVIDLEREQVVGEVPTPYFSEAITFDPSGEHAYIGNRWRDAVLRWSVAVEGAQFLATPEDDGTSARLPRGIPTIVNPRRVVFWGGRLLVSSETTLAIAAYDPVSGAELARHSPNAPVIDLAVVGDFVIILHTGSGTGHPPDWGRDGDGDGSPGDGTANVVFQDLQNEIDVLAFSDLRLLHRYTSDTIAHHDYRDVDPDFPAAGLELGAPDTWTPDRVAFLPPSDTWIVGGAMPERVLPFVRLGGEAAIAVLYGGSSQVQTFDVDRSTGTLSPAETGEELYRTAMGAIDGVFVGPELVVVSRLAESIAVLDLSVPSTGTFEEVVVGDVAGGRFPATDSELGEAFNTLTALFTVDGDQTCVHCHREGSPVAKDVAMPLLSDPAFGTRLVMSYRGAGDTRPWFVEAGMDETNFFPVINELARRENFCCEGVDTRIWSRLPTLAACTATPELEGCQHVLHCEDDPPPECASRRYGSPHLTRDAHFRAAAQRVFGRETTFGDVLYTERLASDGTVERRPITLGFAGITQSLGVFLRTRGRLLPKPQRRALRR